MAKSRTLRQFSLVVITAAVGLTTLTGCSATLILNAIDLFSYVAQALATTSTAVNSVTTP